MATYNELCERYRKRKYSQVMDAVTAGLSHADTVAFDLGLLDAFGDIADTIEQLTIALPFAVILATEGSKVIMGKKTLNSGARDALGRSLKSGAAIAVGSGAAAVAGGFAAIPAAVSVRLLIDRYRSKALLGGRLLSRTRTLRALNEKWRDKTLRETRPAAVGGDFALPSLG